ncbi:MAG TPA: LodA/GoxA family CTQ-dependent oxidase, partial [Isosphaeraceae bacterium]|nr:LodA/GoxA family CTQ-dependent oxidase [Isosphaeraceae bacterium]
MFEHLRIEQGGSAPINTDAPPIDCGSDPILALKRMFVDLVLGRRVAAGQDPVQRPVFLKLHGVARGTFVVRPDLPDDLRVGLFGCESFPAWVRFSSDTVPTQPDLKTTLGVAIKLFGVPSPKLLDLDSDASTHDFLFQNHDVFFVDTAKDMCEFTYAGVVLGDYTPYLQAHPTTQQILNDMAKVVPSVLLSEYWSVLSYAFGPDRYVKYKLAPVLDGAAGPEPGDYDDPTYLHADLGKRLREGAAEFRLYVQFQTDPQQMPLDRATVRWDENASPPIHVATLQLEKQDIDARGQAEYGENLAFNPWHALQEHQPVGSIAEARKVVYLESARFRRNADGIPLGEPVEARPIETLPPGRDKRIVRASIHPAIGVARIGNSVDEFVDGPEVTNPPPVPAGSLKDRTGALKRQAALFRIYGYNATGEVVAELTSDNADISWTVHLANTKAAWYQFQIALDIPEAAAAADPARRLTDPAIATIDPSARRNAAEQDRSKLSIDPGPRTIRGANKSGPEYTFDTGKFYDKAVYLGELQTDGKGHLRVLGGRGVSASFDGSALTTFANNDKWHDDISDGPVTAEVSTDGRPVPVEPAWVVVAPPNYAPDLHGVRTLYDLLEDVFIQVGWLPPSATVSFARDIYPLLERLNRLQWVNQGFAVQFGAGAPHDFLRPDLLARLASKTAEDQELQRQVFNTFRQIDRDGMSPTPWPWIYGDAMNLPPISPRQYLELTPTQMTRLRRWVAGDFEDDHGQGTAPYSSLGQVPLAERPAMLDRAALTFCLADAFHPGCEVTWPIRHATMFTAPFRIRHRPAGTQEPDYGPVLTPDKALARTGPLYGQGPGDLSRWMAVPWQADTASCRSGYDRRYDPLVPTFWPARVPNHVLTLEDYQKAIDPNLPRDQRLAAFRARAVWLRNVVDDPLGTLTNMV